MQRYESESTTNLWLYIGGLFLMAVLGSFLVAKFVVPEPYLPLTDKQLQTYQHGKILESFWPKLSAKEKKHLSDLAGQ